jgi:predicted kinase
MLKVAIVLVGIPGSGKSTLLHNPEFYKTYWDEYKNYYAVLSSDDYIEAKAKELGITYSEAFLDHVKDAEIHIKERLKFAIENEQNIVWDQTNLRKKKRNMILSSIPNDYRKIAIEFFVPFEVILERVKKRGEATGKHIGYNILKNMWDTREPVELEEGFDEHIIIRNGTE